MHIAVIADTHNCLPFSVRTAIAEACEIWHLGDICTYELLAELRALGPPLHAICGNCDPRGLAPETLTLQRGGKTFYLVHEPPGIAPEGADFILHGHTHVPRDEVTGGVRFLNPGSVGRGRQGAPPSFAWLEIAAGRAAQWHVVTVEDGERG